MIFPKSLVGKVARGEVTLTIRPATSRPPAHGARRCVKPPDVVEEGQRRTGTIACHIVIADVQQIKPGDVTFKEAKACGFRTTDSFKAGYVAQFDVPFMRRLLDMDDDEALAAAIAHFNAKHAHMPAYAIRFSIAGDTPRFMSTGPVAGRTGDYVASAAMSIEPTAECVPEVWQERFSKAAREQRASFKRDLEIGRQEQRNARRDRLFRAA